MSFLLYNTLSRTQEVFLPASPPLVTLYSCGPTVYNTAHVGNLRAFLFADTLQRWLRYGQKYTVQWVMNITDVDDKTIRDSAKKYPEKDPKEALELFTKYYTDLFFQDLQKIGVQKDHFLGNPRATHYLPQMQQLIQKIMDRGYAYISEGSVYLSIEKYRKDYHYGELVSLDFDNMVSGSRVESDEYEKSSAADFVLWKAKKEGEPFWDFELRQTNVEGVETVSLPGRPGWHIECSAMSKDFFPHLPFDIHTGGIDLCFPHHEDEICQMRAGEGMDTARFWCYNEYLMVDGKKMSKSLGNFYLLADIEAKGFSAEVLRFLMVTNHYQTKLNLSDDSLLMAKNTLTNLRHMLSKVSLSQNSSLHIDTFKTSFFDAMNDDLNVSVALAEWYSFLKLVSKEGILSTEKQEFDEFVVLVENVFGVSFHTLEISIPEDILALAEDRKKEKEAKNWQEADKIRSLIEEKGYTIKDIAGGGYEVTCNM